VVHASEASVDLAAAASIEEATIELWRKNYDILAKEYFAAFAPGTSSTSTRECAGVTLVALTTKPLGGYLWATE
jgi:hypothetical protein